MPSTPRTLPWITVAILVALLAIAGTFAWRHGQRLEGQIGQLEEKLDQLQDQVTAAEERADDAEERAEAAQQRAIEAGLRADDAEARATVAETEAGEATAAQEEEKAARLESERERQAALDEAAQAAEKARLARQEADALRELRERELNRLQQALGKIAETRRTTLGLLMNLGSDRIEFDFDKAELRPENREILSRVAGVLLTAEGFRIEVFGHTDDVGTVEYNQELSERRANAVRSYLVEAGIEAGLITTKGLGKSQPLVDGTDTESRQRNRRVEIAVIHTDEQYRLAPQR